MFIGRPISVAAEPSPSNFEMSSAKTSGGRQRRIIPIGKLIRPPAAANPTALVLVAVLPPGGVGRTMRCVERVGPPRPGRTAFRPVAPVRGMTIGCVVATPEATEEGINPVGCGGLTAGKVPEPGGCWIFGGVACAFATGAATSGGFLSFLPNENNAIKEGIWAPSLLCLSSSIDGALLYSTCNRKDSCA